MILVYKTTLIVYLSLLLFILSLPYLTSFKTFNIINMINDVLLTKTVPGHTTKVCKGGSVRVEDKLL